AAKAAHQASAGRTLRGGARLAERGRPRRGSLMSTETIAARPHSRAPLRVAALVLVGLAASTSFFLATARRRAEGHEAERRANALELGPTVQTQTVAVAPPRRTITLSGEVRAFRETTLYAKVSGYLKFVRVDRGDRVEQNEVLGVIEAP